MSDVIFWCRGAVLRARAGRHRAVGASRARAAPGRQRVAGESDRGGVDGLAGADAGARARLHVARDASRRPPSRSSRKEPYLNALRRLAYSTLGLAYALIVFGAIVRISGSGMGCGDHWPRCFGSWFPPLDQPTLVDRVDASAARRDHGGDGGVTRAAGLREARRAGSVVARAACCARRSWRGR